MGRTVAGGVMDGLGVAVGLRAAGGIEGMASEVFDYEKALARLQITADSTPQVMRDFSGTVEQASRDTGIHRNEILSAASAYVALTGDMDAARASTATWAKIAQATGSTVADISQTAAALSQQMGIGPAQMEETFSALAQQGKAGAIELRDLAGVMSQIAPMWGQFKGGKGIDGVRELGAALQIVKRGFGGDAGETVTGLQGLLVSLQKNAGRFKEHGIKIFNVDKTGKETMRGVFELVDSISKSDLVKHPDAMEKAFGRVEAYRAYLQLVQNREALHKFVEESRDAGLIQRDFNKYLESPVARMEKSWNAIRLAIADAFTPDRIEKFAGMLEGLADKAGTLTEILGNIGDAFGALYDIGKSVRGALTPDDSSLAETTPQDIERERARIANVTKEDIDRESAERGISRQQAVKDLVDRVPAALAINSLQAQHGRYIAAKRAIVAAMRDDKTTPESNKLAVSALSSPDDSDGQGARRAGAEYINAAHLSPETIRMLRQQVQAEAIDANIAAGRGRSTAPTEQPDMAAQFQRAMEAVVPAIGRSVAQAIASTPPPAPTVKIGAEHIAHVVRNARSVNTRPGGRP
jgi:TP901 family phage tail tape measure protein